MKGTNKNKGFSLVEIVVVIAVMVVLLAVLTPTLLAYTEQSRMQKDEGGMDEICNAVNLAMAESTTFDEVFNYSIPNNYLTYTDSSGIYGQKIIDEEFWAPDGSGHALTITFNPDSNGNYELAKGIVNDMTYGNGSIAEPRTSDTVKQCYLEEMGSGLLFNTVRQTIGASFSEKSVTYKNSSYTIFIKFQLVDGIYRSDVYGSFNGTNLTPDSQASEGSGTEEYTPEGDAVQTKPGGVKPPQYNNSDLSGGGGGMTPSYKECTHTSWSPSPSNEDIHICNGCGIDEEHEYQGDKSPSCAESTEINYTCIKCNKTYTETVPPKHAFDNPDDLICNNCDIVFTAYEFWAWDYDIKMDTTTETDAIVVIPETFEYNGRHYKVTATKSFAFADCDQLVEVVIPDSVGVLGNVTFQRCYSLKKVTIPDHITTISQSLFVDCTGLETIELPKNVTSIEKYAFEGCTSLQNITIPKNVTEIKDETFYHCSSLETVTILGNITTIGPSAFSGCSSLRNIQFPDSLTTIKRNAFYNCTSLKDISFPAAVQSIEQQAFCGTGIESVEIPEGITTVASYTFGRCSSLKTIILPSTITSIEGWAFGSDPAVETLIFNNTMEKWNNMSRGNYWNYQFITDEVACTDGTVSW